MSFGAHGDAGARRADENHRAKKCLGRKMNTDGVMAKDGGQKISIREAFYLLPSMFCRCLLVLAEMRVAENG